MVSRQPLLLRIALPVILLGGFSHGLLRAQAPTNPVAPSPASQIPNRIPQAATNVPDQPQPASSKAAGEMTAEMQKLKSEGKLTNNRALASAVRRVVRDNSIQHDIPAPLGAKVIAVHKHPGDLVHAGDKIVTLLVNGKEVPILAKQDGIMQTINVSKGGVIGNSRPRAAKKGSDTGIIRLTLRPLSA
jgi:biotin carboxyl carrier protein